MQTLNNSQLNAVVGGCCASYYTAPPTKEITLPIDPGHALMGTNVSTTPVQSVNA